MLVNGRKGHSLDARDDIFGSIAMMDVKIEQSHPFDPTSAGLQRGNRQGAQITKTHGMIAGRVMTRRT